MLLIDATNLGGGGGNNLLAYLLDQLSDLHFVALVSTRSGILPSGRIEVMQATSPLGSERQKSLKLAVEKYSPDRLLCFGNLPPRERLNVSEVITYFHNAHLIEPLDRSCHYSWKNRIRYSLLRRAVRKFASNTDSWVFQSSYIRDSFVEEYSVAIESSYVFPFFDEPKLRSFCGQSSSLREREGFVYVSDDSAHKNHERLLDAWIILSEKYNLNPELHLTVPFDNKKLTKRIQMLCRMGIRITNHGLISWPDAIRLTSHCKFVIFPSLLETLGLGMVEGCLLGAKVIATNNPALKDIIVPSATMNPLDASSIAEASAMACCTPIPDSRIILRNQIDPLISLLFSTK